MNWRHFWFVVLASAAGCTLALSLALVGLWLMAKVMGA